MQGNGMGLLAARKRRETKDKNRAASQSQAEDRLSIIRRNKWDRMRRQNETFSAL